MLVGELMELTFKEPLNKIAKERLSIGERAARDALKAAGCYNVSGKRGWYYEGDPAVLEQSIYDFSPNKQTKKPKQKDVNINVTKNDNEHVNVQENIPANNNVNIPVNMIEDVTEHITDDDDVIDSILNNDNSKVKIQKGIYFEPDVSKALDRLVKKKKQSEFVNAAVRQVLRAKGML